MDGWDGGIGQLKLSPRGDWLAIGGDHGGLTVWEWQSQNYVMEQKTQGHAVQCASYSPCGTKLITGRFYRVHSGLQKKLENQTFE